MKKALVSATSLAVALGLVASPALAAPAPKAKPVQHPVKLAPVVSTHEVQTVVVKTTTVIVSTSKVKEKAKPVTAPAPKTKEKAKPVTLPAHKGKEAPKTSIPAKKVKDAKKYLEPVNKNITKVTNAVQQLVKTVSAFNSTDVPTELVFYQGAANKLKSESIQLDSLTKQVDHIANKDGKTVDVTNTYALISTAKESITSEIKVVHDLVAKVKAAAPTQPTTPTDPGSTATTTTDSGSTGITTTGSDSTGTTTPGSDSTGTTAPVTGSTGTTTTTGSDSTGTTAPVSGSTGTTTPGSDSTGTTTPGSDSTGTTTPDSGTPATTPGS